MNDGSAQHALNVIEVESVNTNRSITMHESASVLNECVELKVQGVLVTATGLDQSHPLPIRLSSQPIFSHFVVHSCISYAGSYTRQYTRGYATSQQWHGN